MSFDRKMHDVVDAAFGELDELKECNAKLVAALRIAEIELTAHENDRATDNSVSPELKMIRETLAQQSTEKP